MRRLRSVELTAPALRGDDVVVDGAVVGTITSVFGTAALARVGRGVVPPAAVEDAFETALALHEATPDQVLRLLVLDGLSVEADGAGVG
mgnify:CR=1 FL=1